MIVIDNKRNDIYPGKYRDGKGKSHDPLFG